MKTVKKAWNTGYFISFSEKKPTFSLHAIKCGLTNAVVFLSLIITCLEADVHRLTMGRVRERNGVNEKFAKVTLEF